MGSNSEKSNPVFENCYKGLHRPPGRAVWSGLIFVARSTLNVLASGYFGAILTVQKYQRILSSVPFLTHAATLDIERNSSNLSAIPPELFLIEIYFI